MQNKDTHHIDSEILMNRVESLEKKLNLSNEKINELRRELDSKHLRVLRSMVYFALHSAYKLTILLITFQFKKIIYILFNLYQNNVDKSKSKSKSKSQPQSIIIPFECNLQDNAGLTIAVIAHVYYIDLFSEICDYLKNIEYKYNLYISIADENHKPEIVKILKKKSLNNYEIRIVPNIGRDVAPKLVEFLDVYENHKYFLSIHTKKSPHSFTLKDWGPYLYNGLIGSPEIVKSTLSLFELNDDLGMVAPEHYLPISEAVTWGQNKELCRSLLAKMGYQGSMEDLDFPSGTMFWGRSKALDPLLSLNLNYQDFEKEDGQLDGTLAHAIERVLFYCCEIGGFKWLRTVTPMLPETKTNKHGVHNSSIDIKNITHSLIHD